MSSQYTWHFKTKLLLLKFNERKETSKIAESVDFAQKYFFTTVIQNRKYPIIVMKSVSHCKNLKSTSPFNFIFLVFK